MRDRRSADRSSSDTEWARACILGLPVTVVTEENLLDTLADAVSTRHPTVFVGLYAALFRQLRDDETYRSLVAASVTYPDGAGVVAELHKRHVSDATRLATTDLALPISRFAARRRLRVGLYGGAAGVAQSAAAALSAASPGLHVVRTWEGYEPGPSVEDLQAARLDIMFVGLGAGVQEEWAHHVAVTSGVPATFTCGGLFDFLAGERRRAPRWLQRLRLEWAFRVALEPRRLSGRYVLGNSSFLWRARADRQRDPAVAPGHRHT